jgi:hypothetical protein
MVNRNIVVTSDRFIIGASARQMEALVEDCGLTDMQYSQRVSVDVMSSNFDESGHPAPSSVIVQGAMTDGVRVLACLVLILAVTALARNMMRQCRKPTGWLGRWIVRMMNRSHADLISWGLGHTQVNRGDAVLDVGCGGGLNVKRLARMAGFLPRLGSLERDCLRPGWRPRPRIRRKLVCHRRIHASVRPIRQSLAPAFRR